MGKYDDIIYNFEYKGKISQNNDNIGAQTKKKTPEEIEKAEQNNKLIKRKILELGVKYERLQISEISEFCHFYNTVFLEIFIEGMISNEEIAAKLFLSTNSVIFDKSLNLQMLKKINGEEIPEMTTKEIKISENNLDSRPEPEIVWTKAKNYCKNCRKEISSKNQIICEFCGAEINL